MSLSNTIGVQGALSDIIIIIIIKLLLLLILLLFVLLLLLLLSKGSSGVHFVLSLSLRQIHGLVLSSFSQQHKEMSTLVKRLQPAQAKN